MLIPSPPGHETAELEEEQVISGSQSFEEKLEALRRAEIDEIVLTNGTVVRIAVSYRNPFPRQFTQPAYIVFPCCLENESLRRLCSYFFADSWFVQDFCGLVCCALTWFLVVYATCVLSYLVVFVTPYMLKRLLGLAVLWAISLLSIRCHVLAMLTNPGAQTLHNCTESNVLSLPANSEVAMCVQCFSIKPKRTHHCRVCNRCVHRMDHHCPWINNCVGQGNQKYFVLFTLYVFCLCVLSAIIMCLAGRTCISDLNASGNSRCQVWFSSTTAVVCLLCLAMETALFGMFTLVIMCSQVVSIATDENAIDSSDVRLNCRDRIENFENVFGGKFGYQWLVPSYSKTVRQFRRARLPSFMENAV